MVCWCGWVGIFFPFHSGQRKKPYPEHRVSLTSTNEYSMNYYRRISRRICVFCCCTYYIDSLTGTYRRPVFIMGSLIFAGKLFRSFFEPKYGGVMDYTRGRDSSQPWSNGNNKRSRGYLLCFVSEERETRLEEKSFFFFVFER